MTATGATVAATRDDARLAAIRSLAERLAGRREQLARRLRERWRREIIDYRAPFDARILDEALDCALENVDALVTSLESGSPVPAGHFECSRQNAARRMDQGVAMESLLHAGRLWERVCLEMVVSDARTDVPHEREAALEIIRRIEELADRVATAAKCALLDDVAARRLMRHDLLDELVTAKGDGDHALRLARMLHLQLARNYVVVVVRAEAIALAAAPDQPPAARRRLDEIVDVTRRLMRTSTGSLLLGMRDGDLIVLFPTAGPADLDLVKQGCEALCAALDAHVSIGMSGWHGGRAAIPIALVEALDAVTIAAGTGIRGRAVGIEEVLIDSMLDSSVSARRILMDTLQPLLNYDAARRSALIKTLRAYVDTRLSVTKSAAALFVNPNTVVYRLRRIKEVCGRDPHDPDDLLVLSLALKLVDLRSAPASPSA